MTFSELSASVLLSFIDKKTMDTGESDVEVLVMEGPLIICSFVFGLHS